MAEQVTTKDNGPIGRNGNLDGGAIDALEDLRIPTQVKLAGLWATVMFMYIYVDIIGFYQPGVIEDILAGKVWVFDITQTWMLSAVMLMTVPAVMVYLSLAMPARVNRFVNIGLGAFHILLAIGTASGEASAHYIFGSAVEVVLLSVVMLTAWKWPRVRSAAQREMARCDHST